MAVVSTLQASSHPSHLPHLSHSSHSSHSSPASSPASTPRQQSTAVQQKESSAASNTQSAPANPLTDSTAGRPNISYTNQLIADHSSHSSHSSPASTLHQQTAVQQKKSSAASNTQSAPANPPTDSTDVRPNPSYTFNQLIADILAGVVPNANRPGGIPAGKQIGFMVLKGLGLITDEMLILNLFFIKLSANLYNTKKASTKYEPETYVRTIHDKGKNKGKVKRVGKKYNDIYLGIVEFGDWLLKQFEGSDKKALKKDWEDKRKNVDKLINDKILPVGANIPPLVKGFRQNINSRNDIVVPLTRMINDVSGKSRDALLADPNSWLSKVVKAKNADDYREILNEASKKLAGLDSDEMSAEEGDEDAVMKDAKEVKNDQSSSNSSSNSNHSLSHSHSSSSQQPLLSLSLSVSSVSGVLPNPFDQPPKKVAQSSGGEDSKENKKATSSTMQIEDLLNAGKADSAPLPTLNLSPPTAVRTTSSDIMGVVHQLLELSGSGLSGGSMFAAPLPQSAQPLAPPSPVPLQRKRSGGSSGAQ